MNKVRAGLTLGLVAASCSNSSDTAPAKSDQPTANLAGSASTASPLSDVELGRVCVVTIAELMGRSPRIIHVESVGNGIARVSYRRPSDSTDWTNECRVEGDRVIWRGVGNDQSGRWRTTSMDEVVRYSVSDRRITIRVNESDGASIGAPLSVDRDTH